MRHRGHLRNGEGGTWQLSKDVFSFLMFWVISSCLQLLSWVSFCRVRFFCQTLILSSVTLVLFSSNW